MDCQYVNHLYSGVEKNGELMLKEYGLISNVYAENADPKGYSLHYGI